MEFLPRQISHFLCSDSYIMQRWIVPGRSRFFYFKNLETECLQGMFKTGRKPLADMKGPMRSLITLKMTNKRHLLNQTRHFELPQMSP